MKRTNKALENAIRKSHQARGVFMQMLKTLQEANEELERMRDSHQEKVTILNGEVAFATEQLESNKKVMEEVEKLAGR